MNKVLQYIAKAKAVIAQARKAAVVVVGGLLALYGPDGSVFGLVSVQDVILVLTAVGVYSVPNAPSE